MCAAILPGCYGLFTPLFISYSATAQSNRGMRVLIAGTENILDNMYWGNQRSMLITCCIFRLGGVAALLSNRRADARRAKYRLQHLVRTHLGASDKAYQCAKSHILRMRLC